MKLSKSMIATISFCVLVGTLLMHSTQKVECRSHKNAIITKDNLRRGSVNLFGVNSNFFSSRSSDSSQLAAKHDDENNKIENLKDDDEALTQIYDEIKQLIKQCKVMRTLSGQIVARVNDISIEFDNIIDGKPISNAIENISKGVSQISDNTDQMSSKIEGVSSLIAQIRSELLDYNEVTLVPKSFLHKARSEVRMILFRFNAAKKFKQTKPNFEDIISSMNELISEANPREDFKILHVNFELLNTKMIMMQQISDEFDDVLLDLKNTIDKLSDQYRKEEENGIKDEYYEI